MRRCASAPTKRRPGTPDKFMRGYGLEHLDNSLSNASTLEGGVLTKHARPQSAIIISVLSRQPRPPGMSPMLGRGLGPFSTPGLKKVLCEGTSLPPSRPASPTKVDDTSKETAEPEAPIGTSLEGLAQRRRNEADLQRRLKPALACQGFPLGAPIQRTQCPAPSIPNYGHPELLDRPESRESERDVCSGTPTRSPSRRGPSRERRGVPRKIQIQRREEEHAPPAPPWLAIKSSDGLLAIKSINQKGLLPVAAAKKEPLPPWNVGPRQGSKIVTVPQPGVGDPG